MVGSVKIHGDVKRLESYLRRLFKNDTISVKERVKLKDSCEVYVGSELVGVIYKDTEDGDVSFILEMIIFASDLEN